MKQTTRIKCQRDHLNAARQFKKKKKEKKHVCNSVLSRCSSGENELVFRKPSQKLDTNESYEIESIPKLKKARPNSKTTDFAFFVSFHWIETRRKERKWRGVEKIANESKCKYAQHQTMSKLILLVLQSLKVATGFPIPCLTWFPMQPVSHIHTPIYTLQP